MIRGLLLEKMRWKKNKQIERLRMYEGKGKQSVSVIFPNLRKLSNLAVRYSTTQAEKLRQGTCALGMFKKRKIHWRSPRVFWTYRISSLKLPSLIKLPPSCNKTSLLSRLPKMFRPFMNGKMVIEITIRFSPHTFSRTSNDNKIEQMKSNQFTF